MGAVSGCKEGDFTHTVMRHCVNRTKVTSVIGSLQLHLSLNANSLEALMAALYQT